MMSDYDVKFLNKDITPFDGLSLFLKLLDKCHFKNSFKNVAFHSKAPTEDISRFSLYQVCLRVYGAVPVVSGILMRFGMILPFANFWDGNEGLTIEPINVISTNSHKPSTNVYLENCSAVFSLN